MAKDYVGAQHAWGPSFRVSGDGAVKERQRAVGNIRLTWWRLRLEQKGIWRLVQVSLFNYTSLNWHTQIGYQSNSQNTAQVATAISRNITPFYTRCHPRYKLFQGGSKLAGQLASGVSGARRASFLMEILELEGC